MSDDVSIPNQGYRGKRAGRYGTGQRPAQAGADRGTRRLVIFAGGLATVLAALIGASALIAHRSTEVPVVTADPRPVRVKPDNPGGMKIDGAENDVFSAGADTADSKLAAAPENPDRKALRTAAATPAAVVPPAPPVVAAPAPVALAPPPPPPAAQPVPKPAVVASAPPARPPVAAAPALPLPPAPAARPLAMAAQSHPQPAGHRPMVQLAALTSEEAARAEWQQLSKRMPSLLNGRRPDYSRGERNGHVMWRVRTAGFVDEAQARDFCDRVRAKGAGCSVADF